jgi:hypothetical protein
MAESDHLGRLPPELRKEIYSYLLIEDDPITISRYKEPKQHRVVRMGSYRNVNHHDEIYDPDKKAWKKAPPGPDALLVVNKLMNQEAAQVLYGFNHFEFENSAALQSFLECIGDSRQHLRHIALLGQGVIHRYKWAALDASLDLLLQAKGLRYLEFSHIDFCGAVGAREAACWGGDTATLVNHCKPLLESLKASFESQNLDISILDVIKIDLPPCPLKFKYGSLYEEYHKPGPHRHWTIRLRQTIISTHNNNQKVPFTDKRMECFCNCEHAEAKNRELIRSLREEIATQLGMEIEYERIEEDE